MSVFRAGSNKSSVNNFPSVRPTLDLDFANSKTLDSRITFTRASGGSYVGSDGLIKLAGVNEARFDHDPYTGESLGLLVEESRTNLLLRSEEFDNAYWDKPSGATVNPNASISPNGTLTADKVNNFNSTAAIRKDNIFSASTTYTVSIFAKAAEFKYFTFLVLTDTGVSSLMVNLEDGFYLLGDGGLPKINHSMVSYGGGWYRISMSFTTTTVSSGNYFDIRPTDVWPSGTTGIAPQNPDGTSGIYLWGAQLEQASFPTSYIPTVASTRTRAADDASITGRNFSEWYKQDEGTFFVSAKSSAPIVDFIRRFVEISNFETGTRYLIGYSPNTTSRVFITLLGGIGFNLSIDNISSISNGRKVTFSYSNKDFIQSANGILSTQNSLITPLILNVLNIGRDGSGATTTYLNGTISRLTYYPKRLPNAQLQALTK